MNLQIDPFGFDVTTPETVSKVYASLLAAIELLGWRHGRTAGEASELVWADNVEKNLYEEIIPIWIRKGLFGGEVKVRVVVRGLGHETKIQLFHSDATAIDVSRSCFKELIRRADEVENGKFEVEKGRLKKRTISYKELERLAKWS